MKILKRMIGEVVIPPLNVVKKFVKESNIPHLFLLLWLCKKAQYNECVCPSALTFNSFFQRAMEIFGFQYLSPYENNTFVEQKNETAKKNNSV